MSVSYAIVGVMLAAAAYLAVALLLLMVRRARRFAIRSGLVAIMGLVASIFALVAWMNHAARVAGFDDVHDQQNAKRANISLASDWHTQRAGLLAKWEAEAKAVAALEAAAAAANAAAAAREKAAEEAVAAAEERRGDEICFSDDKCLTTRFETDARNQCRPVVEAYAKYDFSWTGSPYFFAYGIDRSAGTIRYSGNSLKLQNGFGVWQRYRYECLYSFRQRKLVNAIIND